MCFVVFWLLIAKNRRNCCLPALSNRTWWERIMGIWLATASDSISKSGTDFLNGDWDDVRCCFRPFSDRIEFSDASINKVSNLSKSDVRSIVVRYRLGWRLAPRLIDCDDDERWLRERRWPAVLFIACSSVSIRSIVHCEHRRAINALRFDEPHWSEKRSSLTNSHQTEC